MAIESLMNPPAVLNCDPGVMAIYLEHVNKQELEEEVVEPVAEEKEEIKQSEEPIDYKKIMQ